MNFACAVTWNYHIGNIVSVSLARTSSFKCPLKVLKHSNDSMHHEFVIHSSIGLCCDDDIVFLDLDVLQDTLSFCL